MSHLSSLQEALRSRNTDGILISSELNQRYLTDFPFSDGYVLVSAEEAVLITDPRYDEAAKEAVREMQTVCTRAGQSMLSALTQQILRMGIRRLTVEDASLSYASYQRLAKELPDGTLQTGGSALLGTLRAVKTPEELARMARAQAITDAAFAHILGLLTPNMTEGEVALELDFFMRRQGAEDTAFSTIAVSGTASSLPHGVPRACKLQPGFLTMDFGAKVEGYCSDMTRTVCIGRATEEMKKVYKTVLTAQRCALDFIREGASCREADRVARDVITFAGYGPHFGHSLGHGVGMYIHEGPSLSGKADGDAVLRRGNVVTVEPGIYLPGRFGCRIEDMVAIDCDGSVRNFTKSPKDLLEL